MHDFIARCRSSIYVCPINFILLVEKPPARLLSISTARRSTEEPFLKTTEQRRRSKHSPIKWTIVTLKCAYMSIELVPLNTKYTYPFRHQASDANTPGEHCYAFAIDEAHGGDPSARSGGFEVCVLSGIEAPNSRPKTCWALPQTVVFQGNVPFHFVTLEA